MTYKYGVIRNAMNALYNIVINYALLFPNIFKRADDMEIVCVLVPLG